MQIKARLLIRAAAGAAACGLMAVTAAASADAATKTHPTIHAPKGAIAVPVGGKVTIFTKIDGRRVPVTFGSSVPKKVTASQLVARGLITKRAATAGTSCWSEENWIYYGPSWAQLMWYTSTVGWCGNGSTISSEGQKVKGWVTITGQVTFWVYQGVLDKSDTMYYNYWAYQDYTQGHFNQCPIIRFACFDDKYPTLTENIYANGSYQDYASG